MNWKEILDSQIISVDNYQLQVSQLVGVILIIVGTALFLFVVRRVVGRFLQTRHVDAGRQFALFQLIKYFAWVVAVVLILEALNIKITLLLAGSAALLVGLGFGLQQIFQDLVSGVFILIEGTIRVNDVIEIDGLVGRILTINLRTSQVLTRDGIVIIVPNHQFIVDNIINWSHNATATRFKVSVGVAYGSDVEKVKEILLACATDHPDVITDDPLKKQNPFVRFIDFGESALLFEVYFWSHNIFYIENSKSEIRFEIDKRFRENGVRIPFPQRDLHLKSDVREG